MLYQIIKFSASALIIVIISEIAKRSTFFASIVASLPLLSILAFIWLYFETGDIEKISKLSSEIFWLVIPSLALFIVFPLLLKTKIGFYLSLGLSILVTSIFYGITIAILKKLGLFQA